MSRAIARFEYSSWARAEAGKPLYPYPPRSANHSEMLGEESRHPPPHQVGLREAVKQQQRRPSTCPAHEYAGFAGPDLGRLEL